MYFRGAQAALVVFDITSRVSFEGAKRWVRDLQRSSEEGLVICLAGNKSDLSHLRQVEAAEAEAYAAEAGLFYLETSARTAFNVEKAFLEVRRSSSSSAVQLSECCAAPVSGAAATTATLTPHARATYQPPSQVARRVPRVNKDASRADGVVMGRSTNAAASAAKASAAAGKKGGGGGGCCA